MFFIMLPIEATKTRLRPTSNVHAYIHTYLYVYMCICEQVCKCTKSRACIKNILKILLGPASAATAPD